MPSYPTVKDILDHGFTELEAINILDGIDKYGGPVEAHWYLLKTATPGTFDPEIQNLTITGHKINKYKPELWSSK